MQFMLLRLFGHKSCSNIQRTVTEFRTTYPTNRPSLQEWAKEYRFGMLYDRKIIYMD